MTIDETRDRIKKAGYVAVGAPVAAVKALNAHFDSLRSSMRDLGDRLGEDLAIEFENWVDEGRSLVDRVTRRIDDETEEARSTVTSARQRMRATAENVRDTAGDTARTARATLTEAPVELTAINGIGPAYATRLHEAGVMTTNALLARTATDESLERLAASTGFSVEQLSAWRDDADLGRIRGIGDEYRTLLQLAGIGSVGELAAADAAKVVEAMETRNAELSVVDQMPSEATVSKWIDAAG